MSDSNSPGKPGQPHDKDLHSRPDLFAARAESGKPPRREESVRILSTRKPEADANSAKNTRPFWFAATAVVCAVAVAGWHATRSDPDAALSASSSPASVINAPSSASLADTAVAALAPLESGRQLERQPIAAAPPSPADAIPSVTAHLEMSGTQADASTRVLPKADRVATRKPGSKQASKTVAKAGSSDSSKAGRSTQARREASERLTKAQRVEERQVAQASMPATRAPISSSTTPPPQREADTDAKVIEALLPYVKRSQVKAGGKSASGAVPSANTPFTER